MKRVALAVAVVLAAFVFGLFTANYKTFPWPQLQPAGQQIAMWLRSAGVLPPLPEPPEGAEAEMPARLVQPLNAGLINFDLTVINNTAPIEGMAGALAVTGGGVLIARRTDGVLDYYDREADSVRPLPFRLPSLGVETYPERFESGRSVPAYYIRYNDVEVVRRADGEHLFVTYSHYDPDKVCFTGRLAETVLPAQWETATDGTLDWRVVHETRPCLPPSLDRNTFGANQAGGRIIAAPDGGILFTTGDYEFDGIGRKTPAVSQVEGSDYGRVLHLDPASVVTEVSRGHRNPQGVVLDPLGRIWVAEHAAMGGDELNLIRPGTNYGWPKVTLGVLYTGQDNDAKFWPGNPRQGRHDGYEPPRYAWVPSVAPSAVALVSGLGPRWDGDLVVSTLTSTGLRHVRLEGDRVLYDEPLQLNRRTRDVAVADGRIYLLIDDGRFAYLTPHEMRDSDPNVGHATNALSELGCIECHSNPARPRLPLVYGKDIAAQADITYSEALAALEGEWTPERLASFLKSPAAFAPGTTMPALGLTDEQIATLVDELRTIRQQ